MRADGTIFDMRLRRRPGAAVEPDVGDVILKKFLRPPGSWNLYRIIDARVTPKAIHCTMVVISPLDFESDDVSWELTN